MTVRPQGMHWRARGVAAACSLLLAGSTPAGAQAGLQLEGAVTAGRAEHRVDAGYGVASSVGTTFGVVGRARAWRVVELQVHGLGGRLRGDTVARADRGMGQVGARLDLLPLPWLAVGAIGTVRAYDAQPAVQRWTMLGAGTELRLTFAGGRMHSLVGGSLLPRVTVSGQPGPDLGVGMNAGLALGIGRMLAGVEYALERYVYPTDPDGGQRHEQIAGLNVRVGARW